MKSGNLTRITCALCCALLAFTPGCATKSSLLTEFSVPLTGFTLPFPNLLFFLSSDTDLSTMTWTEAFSNMHERLAAQYPYTDWKQIDWAGMERDFGPRIAAAESARDRDAYYTLLREYVYAIPDPQMGITEDDTLRFNAVGGGYGFSLVQLEDERIIALAIKPEGPADEAGMAPGADIISWNEVPIIDALSAAPLLWAREPAGGPITRRWAELRLLSRAKPGTTAQVSFKNPGDETLFTTALTAVPDAYASVDNLRPNEVELGEFDTPLTSSILNSGHGYIRIYALAPTLRTPFPDRALSGMIDQMNQEQVPGLIVDLRGNSGGIDNLVAAFAAHFYQEETFYKNVEVFRGEDFAVDNKLRLDITPTPPFYAGPVAVLVDNGTMGPAEGLAMLLQRLPQATVIGFTPTRGAIGIPGGNLVMPEGISIFYPTGRALDEEGQILLEANAAGEGGVQPDIQPPLDAETARRIYQENDDVLLEKAIEVLS